MTTKENTYQVEFQDATGITGGSIRTVKARSHSEALRKESHPWATPREWTLIESNEDWAIYALGGTIITACVEEKK